jgi:hypothetical protein
VLEDDCDLGLTIFGVRVPRGEFAALDESQIRVQLVLQRHEVLVRIPLQMVCDREDDATAESVYSYEIN